MTVSAPIPASLPGLTVLLAPRASTEEILAVLGDYSAAGMLSTFAWIDAAEVGQHSVPATLVRDGASDVVSLQRLLTAQRYGRVRLAVLVPVQARPDDRVPLAAEQTVERLMRSAAAGAEVTLLRLLLTSQADAAPADQSKTLVLEGWHNLLIAPEDSPAPGLGSLIIDALTDPFELARHVAPVICGVCGMWAAIESTPFDTVEIVPGETVRAVRGFYRALDTAEVEDRLRAQLFGTTGQLPLPNGGTVPVVYIDDAVLAAQKMARALWTKRRDILRGPRLSLESPVAQAISTWSAVKMFLRFLGVALRRAPSAWMSSMLGSVSSALASTVQSTMFGRTGSAFAVVSDPQVAGWEELGRSADAMSTALLGQVDGEHRPRPDLSALWADFIAGAMTLADGGRRGGLEPVSIGAGVGVARSCAEVVPGAAEKFSAIPASLAAVIGTDSVEPVDVLAAADLRERLEAAYADQAAGVEARHAAAELESWQQSVSKSYAWQVAAILADFMGQARLEVTSLVDQIRAASIAESVDERLRRRQQAIALILKTFGWSLFVALALLAGAAEIEWVSWSSALLCGGVLIAVYILVSLALFLIAQRDMFAEMNSRKSALSQLEAMQTNLHSALEDLSRLSMAYGQLLSWCRAMGTFLRAPFGVVPPATGARAQLIQGLPRSTLVAVAEPGSDEGDTAVHRIQQRLYRLGWLTRPWEQLLAATAAEVRADPAGVLGMPGAGSGSALDRWSAELAAGSVTASGADVLWGRVQQMFDDPAVGLGEGLIDTLVLADGKRLQPAEFGDGMTVRDVGRAAPFDASLFTHAAQTASSSLVTIDEGMLTRCGLGYRAAVIQAGEGLPAYDFAVLTPARLVAPVDNELPPSSGDLVF